MSPFLKAALISSLACGCAAHDRSFVENGITDSGGVISAEVAAVAHGPVNVIDVEPGQTPLDLAAAGVVLDDTGSPLRYQVSRLYEGVLLRVHFLGTVTARFFNGEAPAGPRTVSR